MRAKGIKMEWLIKLGKTGQYMIKKIKERFWKRTNMKSRKWCSLNQTESIQKLQQQT